ncbi:DUF448 domain-containing protein [Altericroceibacterium spongiae]|uniref:DUF448 domain-containing protein n=1 Tax=Altericroceibacterium spongiae TaxID=2320269 RepID=A0A420EQU9_9SPHN|nr:DUF448 domain-containing protein [Altericroceibacterium spongiae]RKF23049.1 DUF448 domain-containing protein [Altericroceibacterium spongiae]
MRSPRNETLKSKQTRATRAQDDAPERRCIVSGRIASRDDAVRLALSPDNMVLPDALARAPGRGAWIAVSKPDLVEAHSSGGLRAALSRAFKTGGLRIPDDLPDLLENALTSAFLQRLGLEMRAGRLILGSDRIVEQARSGRVSALFHASDAGEDGTRKLDQAWRVGQDVEGSDLRGTRLPLDRVALSVALGRDNVVHMALNDRSSAKRVAIPLRRLQTYKAAPKAASDADGNRVQDQTAPDAVTTSREYEG